MSSVGGTSREAGAGEGGLGPIDVQMSISPAHGCGCVSRGENRTSVRQSFCLGRGGSRVCQMVSSLNGRSEYQTHEPSRACPCYIFTIHDCIANFVETRDGRMVYAVTFADRSDLAPIVHELRDAGATVSVERILTTGEEADDPPVLTEKQREALACAIETGYYGRPRGATLDDLAEELGITSSAVSQRLNAVNRRLIKKYCQQFEPTRLQ